MIVGSSVESKSKFEPNEKRANVISMTLRCPERNCLVPRMVKELPELSRVSGVVRKREVTDRPHSWAAIGQPLRVAVL